MGINNLMKLLTSKAPGSIKEFPLSNYSSKIVACDATIALYEFLTATIFLQKGTKFGRLYGGRGFATGHLVGLLYRNITFAENGIKPIWVFDGKPPENKSEELLRRQKLKEEAEESKIEAEETGDAVEEVKQAKRSIKVTQKMIDEAKILLKLLGMPIVQAKSEAEAQCVAINKAGKAFGVASEDLDSLAYGAKILLRRFRNKKTPIIQISLEKALKELSLTYDQFIDLCILCGSDYTQPIKGIGPVTALKYIQKFGNLECALKEIKDAVSKAKGSNRFKVPENYPYGEAVKTFKTPEIIDPNELKIEWKEPNMEDIRNFLRDNKILSNKRIDTALSRLDKPGSVLVPRSVDEEIEIA